MAVDVGTGSARAAVFDRHGHMLGRAEHPIRMNRPSANVAEQSSEDIWRAACIAVGKARNLAAADPSAIVAIGFDGTCSLVVRDSHGRPLSVSEEGDPTFDTIAWLDHRAIAEAEACTASGHPVLGHAGGSMSPEMQIPKLLWLKRHLPERWRRSGYFFDLADFLTWRASGSLARSHCTLTCKWSYLGHESRGWQTDFLAATGLSDLLERGRLPERATPIGSDLGPLTEGAAEELGLPTACRVSTGLIDAHAGVLGSLVGRLGRSEASFKRHATLMIGTSSSVMALSPEPLRISGAWGPHRDVVLPGYWLHDAGQSASGALLDHVLATYGDGAEPDADTHRRVVERIRELRALEDAPLASRLHVLPDFHGNRSPLAAPRALGVISGLRLERSFDSLCRLYWRTAIGLALGIRHILEGLNAKGYAIDSLHAAGGHTKSSALTQLYADATGCTLLETEEDQAVLRGTAAAAATAAGLHDSLEAAAAVFAQTARERRPDPQHARQLERDYRVFLDMHRHQQVLDEITR
ncbi:MAG: FGGY-family carbohydrate kinase [Alphaproteobacteria bacterium]